jgi:hypothetical protein
MILAFLGGWEILLLLAAAAGVGGLMIVTVVVVLLVNLKKLRGNPQPPATPPIGS